VRTTVCDVTDRSATDTVYLVAVHTALEALPWLCASRAGGCAAPGPCGGGQPDPPPAVAVPEGKSRQGGVILGRQG
jgi:hypothetical protein